jgi:heptosyltransferase-2
MKLLIEVPTWLGDCVMATPAIENIVKHYPDVKITIFGAYVSTAIFEKHPSSGFFGFIKKQKSLKDSMLLSL